MATSVPPIETVPPSEPGLSEIQRVVDTFVAPSKTFTDIRRSSAWWFPFLITLIVSLAFGYSVQTKVGWRQVMDNNVQSHPAQQAQLDKLTPEQRAQRESISLVLYPVISYGYSVFGLIAVAIVAGILMLVYNFGFGAHALYKQYFATYMYAALPSAVKALLTIVLVFAGGGGEKFSIENPIGTNPGFYFATGSIPAWLHALLISLDVFTIWRAVLLAIGLSIVCGVSRNKSYAAVFGLWGIVILFGVASAAIFG
jgi:hypothetical protein